MSKQRSPAKTPLPSEDPRWLKARRDKSSPPTVRDFPVGARFVGRLKETDGFQTHLLCEIVDAYACKALGRWDSPVCVYARVIRVTEQRHAGLAGHLVKITSAPNETWYYRDIVLTDLPEAQPWL